MARIRIYRAGDDALDSGGDNRVGARRRATVSTARFKGDVKRCAFWAVTSLLRRAKSLDFRMGFAGAPVPALADDSASLDQNRPNYRIRRSRPVAPAGEAHSKAHVASLIQIKPPQTAS